MGYERMSKGPETPQAEVTAKEQQADKEHLANYEALNTLFSDPESLMPVEGWDMLDSFAPDADRITTKVVLELGDGSTVESLLSQVTTGDQIDYHLVTPDTLEKIFDTRAIRQAQHAMENPELWPPAQFDQRRRFMDARGYFNTFAPQIQELQPYLEPVETE